jgi:hypothetical protein
VTTHPQPHELGDDDRRVPARSFLCSDRDTGAKTRMKNARNAFVAACGMPGSSSFMQLTGQATIRGVGFFDFIHGQTGVAPNGIELHPVLRFANATCTG